MPFVQPMSYVEFYLSDYIISVALHPFPRHPLAVAVIIDQALFPAILSRRVSVKKDVLTCESGIKSANKSFSLHGSKYDHSSV